MNSNGCEEEQSSLDYIEDPYFNPQVTTSTPSLDDLDDVEYLDENDILENELELFDLRQLDFDDLNYNSLGSNGNDESVNVETEFFNVKRANAIIRAFFRKNFKKQVRVTYRDLTKPYLARLPKDNNFRKYLDISNGNAGKFWLLLYYMQKSIVSIWFATYFLLFYNANMLCIFDKMF